MHHHLWRDLPWLGVAASIYTDKNVARLVGVEQVSRRRTQEYWLRKQVKETLVQRIAACACTGESFYVCEG